MIIHRRHNLSHEEMSSHSTYKEQKPAMKSDFLFDIERLNRQIEYLNQSCYTADDKTAAIDETVDESKIYRYSKLVWQIF